MKRTKILAQVFILVCARVFAQTGSIDQSINDELNTVPSIFPLIHGVIYIIGFLFNEGHFFLKTPT